MSEQVIERAWGRERILEQNGSYVVKILEIDAARTLDLKYHDTTVTMYCLYGNGTLCISNNDQVLERFIMPGRYQTIDPHAVYELSANPTSQLAILEISTTCDISQETCGA